MKRSTTRNGMRRVGYGGFRIGVGFTFGCILSIFAFARAGVGHGTYTPLAANAPMLVFIPKLGIWPLSLERLFFGLLISC